MAADDRPPITTCRQQRSKHKSGGSDAVSILIATFNTWAFKRQQPSDPDRLRHVVRGHLERQQPIEFVLYWGKGPRVRLGAPEMACLDYLAVFVERIRSAYPPSASIRLICTDTHALLNGHPRSGILAYFYAVGEAARKRGFHWCLLGDLVRHQGPINGEAKQRCDRTVEQLERSAAKWYRGGGRPIDGALAYYDMNMIEKHAVEREFPDAIFITFSGPELKDLFPAHLPIFYMYSVRKGVSVKPWFIDDSSWPDLDQGDMAPSSVATS